MHTHIAFGSFIGTALVAALAASCAQIPGADIFDLPQPDANRSWVFCDSFDSTSVNTKTIHGGQADTLMLPRGHVLSVPGTAVPRGQSVDVTFTQLAGPAVAVMLEPHARVFEDSMTLTLSHQGRDCDVTNGQLRIYRVRMQGPPHEVLPPARGPGIDPPSTVRGRLDRFSAFALAR